MEFYKPDESFWAESLNELGDNSDVRRSNIFTL